MQQTNMAGYIGVNVIRSMIEINYNFNVEYSILCNATDEYRRVNENK